MLTDKQKKAIKEITAKYDPVLIGMFGSYARNEQTGNSDLDLLIDFESNRKISWTMVKWKANVHDT